MTHPTPERPEGVLASPMREVSLLPVVQPEDRERFEGTVSRQDLMAAHERALTAEGH